ncbi:hypothetical protein sos41_09560 [Alphaproteobacteria bacterium SO-S41]|nr:hypothetical protein sos41_09560 [Alphaproteobacteria bacterium SO-S41]
MSGYCHDQGFEWSLVQENYVGRAFIAAAFVLHSRLAQLMPLRAACLADGLPIGDVRDWAELEAAKAALAPERPKLRRRKAKP